MGFGARSSLPDTSGSSRQPRAARGNRTAGFSRQFTGLKNRQPSFDFDLFVINGKCGYPLSPTRRRHAFGMVNTSFHFRTEMTDQTLDRPGRSIPEGTDGVPFNLARHLFEQINFLHCGVACHHSDIMRDIQPVPSRTAYTGHNFHACKRRKGAIAATISVDLSITIIAAVPSPECCARSESKSISTVSQIPLGGAGLRHRPE